MSSLMLLLAYPIMFWLYKRPGSALSNIWNVLRGHYHLVGYIRKDPEGLPSLKQGLLNMLDRVKGKKGMEEQHSAGLDRHYARSWSWELDVEILLKGLRRIGG